MLPACTWWYRTGTTQKEFGTSSAPIRIMPPLHPIDTEVLAVIRQDHRLGRLDPTAAAQAVDDLRAWPGERFGHRTLLSRAWELRDNVRSWDALYVALAEGFDATLLTLDARLARATGIRCRIEEVAIG